MGGLGRVIKTGTALRFRAGQSPEGVPWIPSRRVAESGGRTLALTNRLRGSITYRATSENVAIGTNLPYARIHQLGGTIKAKGDGYLRFKIGKNWVQKKSVTIPARPYLGASDADKLELIRVVNEFLSKSWDGPV